MSAELVKAIAENTIAFGILAFLCRSIIVHWLDKDLGNFKTKLELEAQQTLALHQSELEKERIRLQIQYGGVYQRQAEAIVAFYKLITSFQAKMDAATFDHTNKTAGDSFLEAWRNMTQFYEENQILFPESIEKAFNKFHKTAFFASTDYRNSERLLDRQHISQDQLERLLKRQDKALANLDAIPALKTELKSCMRTMLGVHESS